MIFYYLLQRTLESFKTSGDGGIRTKGAPPLCSGALLMKSLKLLAGVVIVSFK